jgi:putative ABC transport system permease protein
VLQTTLIELSRYATGKLRKRNFVVNKNRAIMEGMQSLFANRVQSVLSILGIVFGVAAVVAMLAVIEGARSDVLERLSRLGTNVLFVLPASDDSPFKRTLQFGDALRLESATDMIDDVAPALLCATQKSRTVIGVTSSYIPVRQLGLQGGRAITDLDVQNRSRVCVIGRDVIGDDGKSVGVGGVIHVEHQVYKVVGVLTSERSTKDRSLSSLMRNHNSTILIPLTVAPKSAGVIQNSIPLSEITIRSHFSHDLLPLKKIAHRV